MRNSPPLFLLALFACTSFSPLQAAESDLTSPLPGTTLSSSTAIFTWTPGSGRYLLYVGTEGPNSDNIFNSGFIDNGTHQQEVENIPTNTVVYVRLWCETASNSGRYFVSDHTYNSDADNDSILDIIDPNPGVTDPKPSFTGADYTLTILGSGRVASLESISLFNNTFDDMSTTETREITTRIFEQLDDDFDFIILASNQSSVPGGSYFGRFYNAQNDIAGIGMNTFDNTTQFGSAGKLQGAMHLTSTGGLSGGPSLHELAHNWGNSMDSVPTAVGGHWGRSNIGGQLGGWQPNSLEDLGGGQYRARNPNTGDFGSWGGNANGGNGLPYSNFELYTMGLITAGEVGQDIKIAHGFAWMDSNVGTFSATSITTNTMADVVTIDGARLPDTTTSQKNFRILYVIVTPTPLTTGEWSAFDEDVYNFDLDAADSNSSYNFWEATGGRATLTMDGILNSVLNNPFTIDTVSHTTSQTGVQLPSERGFIYTLQYSTNLVNWVDADSAAGDGNALTLSDNRSAMDLLYYRVMRE
jgi:hypothetical protein